MIRPLLSCALGGVAVLALPLILPGIKVRGFRAALTLVVVMALCKLLLWVVFGFFLAGLYLLTLGLAYLVVNAVVLDLSADFVDGVEIDSFRTAFLGSLSLSILWTGLNHLVL